MSNISRIGAGILASLLIVVCGFSTTDIKSSPSIILWNAMHINSSSWENPIRAFFVKEEVVRDSALKGKNLDQWKQLKGKIESLGPDLGRREEITLILDFVDVAGAARIISYRAHFILEDGFTVDVQKVVHFEGGSIWKIEDGLTGNFIGVTRLPPTQGDMDKVDEFVAAFSSGRDAQEMEQARKELKRVIEDGDCGAFEIEANGVPMYFSCAEFEEVGAGVAALWNELDHEGAKRMATVLEFLEATKSRQSITYYGEARLSPLEIMSLVPTFSPDALPIDASRAFSIETQDGVVSSLFPPSDDVYKEFSGKKRWKPANVNHSFTKLIELLL